MSSTSRSTKQFFSTATRQWRELLHRSISALEKQRRVQILVAVVVSFLCTSVFAESIVSARTQREKWSSDVSVLVLTRDVAANTLLTSSNTQELRLPTALVSVDAIHVVRKNMRTRVALTANTPLTQSLLIPASEFIDVPTGWRIVALPADASLPPLKAGDRVDLIAGGTVIASNCIIYSTSPYAVAVPLDVASQVANAARIGDISVVSYAWHS